LARGEPVLAVDLLSAALDQRPSHSAARYKRGIALSLIGKPEDAMVDYVRAIELDPRNLIETGTARMNRHGLPG